MRLVTRLSLVLTGQMLSAIAMAESVTRIDAESIATAVRLRDAASSDEVAWQLTESLTTEIGARLAGSAGDARAVAWAQRKFAELGYDKVWTEPVTFPKWVRRGESAAVLGPFAQPLTVAALGLSVGTGKRGIVADVVAFDSLADLQNAPPGAVKGRIAYVGDRMRRERDGSDYSRAAVKRRDGASIAARLGAVALLIRSSGTDQRSRTPHTGAMKYLEGVPRIPAGALSNPDADQLERIMTRGQGARLRLVLDCGFEGNYTSHNVIGEISGGELAEQVVLIGGHLDSWDLGTGAIDDAAGVAITMAAGAAIGHLDQAPRRSIRVVAFANEEQGALGGKAYATLHGPALQHHLIGSEADFGAGRIFTLHSQVKTEALGAIDQIMQVLGPLGVVRGDSSTDGGADIGQMRDLGMAAVSLVQDGTHYFDYHHTANDTLDKIDREALQQNVAVYVAFTYLAAQAEGDFGTSPLAWGPPSTD